MWSCAAVAVGRVENALVAKIDPVCRLFPLRQRSDGPFRLLSKSARDNDNDVDVDNYNHDDSGADNALESARARRNLDAAIPVGRQLR